MKVCIVSEGCYPYVVGGVSGWVDSLIRSFPKTDFVLLTILANRSQSGKFLYQLPDNVIEVHETYLNDMDSGGSERRRHKKRIGKKEYQALRSVLLNQDTQWEVLFDMFQNRKLSLDDLLMGEDFLQVVADCYQIKYSQIVFSDFLWTMRSIYLPLFLTLKTKLPKADLYHCITTGYAGVLGCMAKHQFGCRLLISEHGIYTREREEELIRAKWVKGIYKNIWIEQFRKLSNLAYEKADLVISLYERAKQLQIELNCPANKIQVTPNGIAVEKMENLPGKTREDEGKINIGAIVRVTPIKDIKTLIQAFAFAKEKDSRLKLWIMGPWDEDEEYAKECMELADVLRLEDVEFTGRIDVRDYLGRMDMTILTSISEGQPLTILESFAARKPVIATDVGDCRELIYGHEDMQEESAGIITHVMNMEEIADAILKLASDDELRLKMGENGYLRVISEYRIEYMRSAYWHVYKDFAESIGKTWKEELTKLPKEASAGHDECEEGEKWPELA